ncbi:MAG TPA: DUF87 domain-containing protein [Candidatus Nanoarchaeia archaeon]|nr:DUF87 domain-containing protein [Candidatus Nanoarchaeia archaeon]
MAHQNDLVEEMSKKLRPILGNRIDDLYFKYSIAEDYEEKNELLQFISTLYRKHLGGILDEKVLLEPPKKESVQGEYKIGTVEYADKKLFPFALQERDWSRHVCISGMSGSGKTTLALNILSDFIKKDNKFLVFDWKKSFRPLMNKDKSLMTFTVGNKLISNLFKININIPPKGVDPKEWINVLCDLITESFAVSFGVHKIILETLDEVFEKWGIYEGYRHFPTWRHIKKMLEMKSHEAGGRESQWYESALRVASILTYGGFGEVINYEGKRAFSVEDLFDKRVVFELSSLSNIEKKFFSEFVLTYIYKTKKTQEAKKENAFDYTVLVDEAHNVFLKDKTNFVSESVTDMVYRELREYGVSLICLDQHISKLSDTVKGNSACHIAFQQQLPQDIYDISSLMQLREKKEFFSRISVGKAIVKLTERHSTPFLISVPKYEDKGYVVSNDVVKNRMKALVEGVEITEKRPEFKKAITQRISEIELNDDQKKFMDFLLYNPEHEYGTVEFYKKAGFSPRKGNQIKNQLHKKGLVEVKEEKYPNGWKKFIRLKDHPKNKDFNKNNSKKNNSDEKNSN